MNIHIITRDTVVEFCVASLLDVENSVCVVAVDKMGTEMDVFKLEMRLLVFTE